MSPWRTDSFTGWQTQFRVINPAHFHIRNPRGYTSSVVHDGLGRSVLSTDAKSNTVETIYDNNSNVLQTKRTEVETSTQTYYSDFHYDAADRQILSVDTLGNTHRSFYDSTSQLVASTDANSSGTASIATQSRGGSFSITGNSNGNRIFYLTDRLGRSLATIRELRVNHDGANSVDTSNSYNSDGLITTSTFYDDNSRATSRTDEKNNATSYAYDALNRKTSETFADSTSRSWTYDKDGHVLSFTDQNGSVISTNAALGLDAKGRLIKQTFSSGSGVATLVQQLFEYDGLSRVTKSTSDTGAGSTTAVTECSFDSLSRCLSEDQTLGSQGRTVAQSVNRQKRGVPTI